ncbi:MAG: hypothetical protein KYX60_01015 [Halomonas meridiana]|uniref:hypothetical protein n=1 Tax=Vreelandella aquamarina TaxID=77097 RepID=UPI0024E1D15C|nr:hypothetical protein [Halomonas meridiana]MDK2749251.1 hypothetical protein [Halomonas meridiana]
MAHDDSTGGRTAPPLHRFSEQGASQRVASSWSLISDLEQLPSQAAGIADLNAGPILNTDPMLSQAAPSPAPEPITHTPAPVKAGSALPAHEPSHEPPVAASNPAAPAPHSAAESPTFGQLFNGYSAPRQSDHGTQETPLKPLLHAIAQQGSI